jgi:hypothetical protein
VRSFDFSIETTPVALFWRDFELAGGFRPCLDQPQDFDSREVGKGLIRPLTFDTQGGNSVDMMTTARDHLSKAESLIVAAVEARAPTLVEARLLIARFQEMIRKKADGELDPWIADARQSLVASFARGVVNDLAAVRAAISSPWSNGQTEGQITKLKLVKRQMYGRAKVDLLEARLLGAA